MSNQNGCTGWIPQLGNRVRVLGPSPQKGRIIELRGDLGPGGGDIFGVELEYSDHTAYIEVRGDQLELLNDETPAPQCAPST